MDASVICTVLLISYNHAPWVRRCIDSVISQVTEYEYVIHIFDDGSTDGTINILKEYEKKYPKLINVFIADENQGAVENVWKAYKSVKTKYFILTETDDYWCDENKLQLQISALESHEECVFCATNTHVEIVEDRCDENAKSALIVNQGTYSKSIIAKNDVEKLRVCFTPHISSRLIRTKNINLDSLKYKESFTVDASQFFYLLSIGSMYWLDMVSTVYVKTGKGFWSNADYPKRMSFFSKALICMNEDTNGIWWNKILQQLVVVTRYYDSLNDRGNRVRDDVRVTKYKLFGITLFKIRKKNRRTDFIFLGITIISKFE